VYGDCCKHGIKGLRCEHCYPITVRAKRSELASLKQVGGSHYKDMAIQPSEFIFKCNLNWLEGNAVKYICRHKQKHGAKDLDKAIHYLELLKEWEYANDD